ncbi:hypothetical protein IG631_20147 [Alternaria alternata]|nr:hypothetical protein IG631_20147 [Alternaria alternata]
MSPRNVYPRNMGLGKCGWLWLNSLCYQVVSGYQNDEEGYAVLSKASVLVSGVSCDCVGSLSKPAISSHLIAFHQANSAVFRSRSGQVLSARSCST